MIRKLSLKDGYEVDADEVLHWESLPYMSKIIRTELISRHHGNSLVSYFGIENTYKLVTRKYYQPTLQYNGEAYVKSYSLFFAFKVVCHKSYGNLQLLPISTHY